MTTVTAKQLRADLLQWTQDKMAREMGVSLRTWCRWEAGRMPRPAWKALARLAEAHGATLITRRAKDSAPAPGCAPHPAETATPPRSACCPSGSAAHHQSADSAA